MSDQNADLLELVRGLTKRIDSLETEIKSLRLLQAADVPEDTMVAIAAAVSACLGNRRRTPQFEPSTAWQAATRRSQQNNAPIHLR